MDECLVLRESYLSRFKVVKLVSSEPYFRGRWNCFDYKTDSDVKATNQSTAQDNQSQAREQTHDSSHESSGVAIDNKIEQAMDLVKSHLMFAVREEVDVLKERIKELELEISLLRQYSSAETLAIIAQQLSQNQSSE